jgi:hypothetical protein
MWAPYDLLLAENVELLANNLAEIVNDRRENDTVAKIKGYHETVVPLYSIDDFRYILYALNLITFSCTGINNNSFEIIYKNM